MTPPPLWVGTSSHGDLPWAVGSGDEVIALFRKEADAHVFAKAGEITLVLTIIEKSITQHGHVSHAIMKDARRVIARAQGKEQI